MCIRDRLKAINESEGAFPIPQIESFMNRIYCHSLKAKSSDKTDIRIILHDRRTKINSEMGFSIKSVSYTHLDVYKRQAPAAAVAAAIPA